MKIQLFKFFNCQYYEIDIANVKKDDIIKAKDLDTNEYIPNAEGSLVSICIGDSIYNEEDKSWSIQSKSYHLEEEIINEQR